jgi:hypothetical protein
MKTAVLGALVGAGLVIAAAGAAPDRSDVLGQRAGPCPSVAAGGDLIALCTTVGDKYQQLTVLDPKQKVLSVYHVELATGNVRLCCVRAIHWDLQMTHYNGENPLPREIQSLLEPR